MKTKWLIGLMAASLMFALAMPSYAKESAEAVTCKDGTSSNATGRGACSGHGGVKKDAAATEKAAVEPAKEKTAKPAKKETVAAPAAAAAPAAPAAAPAAASRSAPAAAGGAQGATAKCKDGTYSHSTGHKGACSHHGGVGEWLKDAK